MAILETSDVGKRYGRRHWVIRHVDIAVVEWIPKYPRVAIVVPGTRYRFVETREAGALAGGSIVALGLGALV